MIRYDKRTVIITGAGGGLGRAYALFLASRGAQVVVNDVNKQNAERVVSDILALGGKAVVDTHTVTDGQCICKTALDAFGSVDILINNAGILRDKSFAKMTQMEWDSVMAVHVHGTISVTKAVWPIMQKQKYGRIINTTSAAGLYGNVGQANYSAAKHAIHGFTLSLAKECKNNITCNSIAPIAASPMTETVMPEEILKEIKPEHITGLVGFLCSDLCVENGSLFELGAGFVAKVRRQRTQGLNLKEVNAESWKQVCKYSNPQYPLTIMDNNWTELLKTEPYSTLSHSNRCVIVTGAGAGLGRAYALHFASKGANVVVNDLKNSQLVVDEIKAKGGKAISNSDSVLNADAIIQCALNAFGRIDVVVNNAGIIRDKSFIKMTADDINLVLQVHLDATFKVCKAVWPIMQKQKFGRIINTSSAVGLYGNFGQTNYSTAKAGILGLSSTLAHEGKRNGIIVNVIAPNAGTNMTATVMPPEMVSMLKPDLIAPIIGFLGHESCTTSGVYECGSGWAAQVRFERAKGMKFSKVATPEDIRDNFTAISDFKMCFYPTSAKESFQSIYEAKSNSLKAFTTKHTERDVILYALGVGATDLNMTYENASEFTALPTYGIIMGFGGLSAVPFEDFLPNFNPMMLLHGEQYLEIYKDIPTTGTFQSIPEIVEIKAKGKATIVTIGVRTMMENQPICYNESVLYVRNSNGATKEGKSKRKYAKAEEIPNRAADHKVLERTDTKQALLYRLSGDLNPLHVDPNMAKLGGFPQPILHGLCTMGYACRHIQKHYKMNIKAIQCRMTSHVFPGQSLLTEMWQVSPSRVVFRVSVPERDAVVLANAAVDFAEANGKSAPSSGGAAKIFEMLGKAIEIMNETDRKALKTNAVFAFVVNNTEYIVDLKNYKVFKGTAKSDVTITISDDDLVAVAQGRLSGQKAFMQGKLKVKGNMMLATKLDLVFKLVSNKSKM